MVTAPFGAWRSPIAPADVAKAERRLSGAAFCGDEVWWSELRSEQGGRNAVFRRGDDGSPIVVLPEPWNARSRVHEYGGGAWLAEPDGLIFVNFVDQRLYRLAFESGETSPLTPAATQSVADRYVDPMPGLTDGELLCIRETHTTSSDGVTITRAIVAVPRDGSAADDRDAVRVVAAGSHFLALPTISPDGKQLAWIAWEHPQLPWDGTELRVATLSDGVAESHRRLMGGPAESVLGPVWVGNGKLIVSSDRSGWWNLYEVSTSDGDTRQLFDVKADIGGPMWNTDMRWHHRIDDDRIVFTQTLGIDSLAVLDLRTGSVRAVAVPGLTHLDLEACRGDRLLVIGRGAHVVSAIREIDLATAEVTEIRPASDSLPPKEFLPDGRMQTFSGVGGRDVHAVVYPPKSPDQQGPPDELPPFVIYVHGGPTAHSTPECKLSAAFWTSRGIGVAEVNYGGSTGYGRDYRERLRGQWGIVDVEDVVAVATGLADAGLADRSRIAIRGGSAGGWTVLAALTTSDAFACGMSQFGVADLLDFGATTHDFESRYLDGLVGPLPEARDLWITRSPVNNVDGLSTPVLLMQGLDDPIVPPSQAEIFKKALETKGILHAYLPFAGESHGFRKAETIIATLEAELSFFGQVCGFEPVDIPLLALSRG